MCPNALKAKPIYRKNSAKHILALHRGCDCRHKQSMRIQEVIKDEDDDDTHHSQHDTTHPSHHHHHSANTSYSEEAAHEGAQGQPLESPPLPPAATVSPHDSNGGEPGVAGHDGVERLSKQEDDVYAPVMQAPPSRRRPYSYSNMPSSTGEEEKGSSPPPTSPSTEPRKKQKVVLVKTKAAQPRQQPEE